MLLATASYDICVQVRQYTWTLRDILNKEQYIMSCIVSDGIQTNSEKLQ